MYEGCKSFNIIRRALNMSNKKQEKYITRNANGNYEVKNANAEKASRVFETQAEAIDWGKPRADGLHIQRVRHTSEGNPDQFRKK